MHSISVVVFFYSFGLSMHHHAHLLWILKTQKWITAHSTQIWEGGSPFRRGRKIFARKSTTTTTFIDLFSFEKKLPLCGRVSKTHNYRRVLHHFHRIIVLNNFVKACCFCFTVFSVPLKMVVVFFFFCSIAQTIISWLSGKTEQMTAKKKHHYHHHLELHPKQPR